MLKRIVSVILILICLQSSALASDIAFDNMELNELIALRDEVEEEIAKKLIKASSSICAGIYEVGVSIDAGNYMIILSSYREEYGGELLIFENRLAYNDYHTYLPKHDPLLYLQDIPENEPLHLALTDGEILILGYGDWVIQRIE